MLDGKDGDESSFSSLLLRCITVAQEENKNRYFVCFMATLVTCGVVVKTVLRYLQAIHMLAQMFTTSVSIHSARLHISVVHVFSCCSYMHRLLPWSLKVLAVQF